MNALGLTNHKFYCMIETYGRILHQSHKNEKSAFIVKSNPFQVILKGGIMKIASITQVGKQKVYDLSVQDAEHYVLENGVVTHNTGIYYSADNIFIIGRQQEKEGTDVVGYNFIINVEKSRYVKEKSKIPVEVTWSEGISKWSGLIDMALASGHVIKPKNGWYQRVDMETGEISDKSYRLNDTYNFNFWQPILQCPKFAAYIEDKYCVGHESIMKDEDDVSEVYESLADD